MINERSSAQPNTPTSANMPYGYAPNHFDMMNMPTMQNPTDVYSYYNPSLYHSFNTFDEHSQWASADTPGNVPPPPPGPMPYHPQLYAPSPIDMPRTPFDYPLPHAYQHYHPGFTSSTFAAPPSSGTSAFDMSWTPHSLSMQQMQVAAQQQQMTPIVGGPISNKRPSAYDDYPSGGVGDMLAQRISSVNLNTTTSNDETNNYDNGTNDNAQNVNVLSSKEQQQQQYQSNTNNLSLSSRSPQINQSSASSGPKSYASVLSADTLNTNSNKPTSSIPNMPIRSTVQSATHERNVNTNNTNTNFSNDSNNSRSNTNLRNNNNNTNNYSQQTRNGTGGFNSRNQQQQQQQQSSASGGFPSWTNSSLPSNSRGGNNNTSSTYYNSGSSNYYDRSSYSQQQTSNKNNNRQNSNYQQNYSSRTANNLSNGNTGASAIGQQPLSAANQEILDALKQTHQYNPKDFNLNPKGARFFVIKSYSEDDVHRSIKYNIWCSTEHGNKRLDTAFREREGKGPVYLFFSVNASGHFCGMAEMMSPLDYEHKTDVWHMSNKWQGKFEVKWIYVKDVPNQQFRNIRLENNENKPVTNSRDTQEIPYEKGKLMLKTFHMYRHKTSIFDDFQYYESKQAEETTTKKSTNRDLNNNSNNPTNTSSRRQLTSNRLAKTEQEDQQN